jgi:hypothetical protein
MPNIHSFYKNEAQTAIENTYFQEIFECREYISVSLNLSSLSFIHADNVDFLDENCKQPPGSIAACDMCNDSVITIESIRQRLQSNFFSTY